MGKRFTRMKIIMNFDQFCMKLLLKADAHVSFLHERGSGPVKRVRVRFGGGGGCNSKKV